MGRVQDDVMHDWNNSQRNTFSLSMDETEVTILFRILRLFRHVFPVENSQL